MRIHRFCEPFRPPADIPMAGGTLAELLGKSGSTADVFAAAISASERELLAAVLLSTDEIRHFRTPNWTWALMAGIEGWLVLRDGNVVFWIATRMN